MGYYNADESMSWLHERNIQVGPWRWSAPASVSSPIRSQCSLRDTRQAFLNKSGTLTAEGKAAILSDPGYGQSNLMHWWVWRALSPAELALDGM